MHASKIDACLWGTQVESPEGRDDLEVASGRSGASSVGEESGRQLLILHTRNVLRTLMRRSILALFIDA